MNFGYGLHAARQCLPVQNMPAQGCKQAEGTKDEKKSLVSPEKGHVRAEIQISGCSGVWAGHWRGRHRGRDPEETAAGGHVSYNIPLLGSRLAAALCRGEWHPKLRVSNLLWLSLHFDVMQP